MNIKFNVVWIDDTKSYYQGYLPRLKEVIKSNNLIDNIVYFEGYDEYQQKVLLNFDKDVFNKYDLLLVDYSLSGKTGDQIINELRDKEIYTDIVFYSSNFSKMTKGIQGKDQLDGVFLADREVNLNNIINNVIKKNLKRSNDIANIRGLLMDSTSEFDFIARELSIKLFESLDKNDQEEILDAVDNAIDEAKNRSEKNFVKVKSKSEKNKLIEALKSVQYVMDNKDRYVVFQTILEKTKQYNKDKEGNFKADTYACDLIKPRNDLAHQKLYYGECGKKIQKATNNNPNKCLEDCDNCESVYDVQKCEELRKLMFKYYCLFTELNNKYYEI